MADEEPEAEKPVALTPDVIGKALKGLSKTIDGTGFALTQLELIDQKLGDIGALSAFQHIRYLNLSKNLITDLKPLETMTYLLSLNVSHNKLVNIELPQFQFLQILDLTANHIVAIQNMAMPMLRDLKLGENQIENVSGMEGNVALKILELHNNKLTSCTSLGLATISILTLTGNQIISTAGLEQLTDVESLDFTGNALTVLAGLPKGKLTKLCLKQNQIATYEAFDALAGLQISDLDVTENPIADGFDRIKILRRVASLQALNGAPITDEERAASHEPETPAEAPA